MMNAQSETSQLASIRRNAVALNNAAVCFHDMNVLDEAARHYGLALRQLKGSTEMQLHQQLGTHDNAKSLNESMIAQAAEVTSSFFAQDEIGGPESVEALSPLSSASGTQPVAIEPNDSTLDTDEAVAVVITYNMAMLSIESARWGKAARLLRIALAIVPSETDVDSSLALLCLSIHFQLGVIHSKLFLYGESNLNFMSAIQLGMSSDTLACSHLFANVLRGVGRILSQRGHVRDAMALFETASLIHDKLQKEAVGTEGEENNGVPPSAAPAA